MFEHTPSVVLTIENLNLLSDESQSYYYFDLSIPGSGVFGQRISVAHIVNTSVYSGITTTKSWDNFEDYSEATWSYILNPPREVELGYLEDGLHPFMVGIQLDQSVLDNTVVDVNGVDFYLHPAELGTNLYWISQSQSAEDMLPWIAYVNLFDDDNDLGISGTDGSFGSFLHGFAMGLGRDTPVSVVEGVYDIGKMIWHLQKNYGSRLKIATRIVQTGTPLTESDQETLETSIYVAQELYTIVQGIYTDQYDIIERAYAGDLEAIGIVGNQYAVAIEYSVEIIQEVQDAIGDMSAFDQGRILGRVVGEVALTVATSTTGVGVISKSTALRQVITKLRAIDDLPTGVITKLDEILNFGIVAKLESPTMRMCFVAGTLVHTDDGLVPIEEIQVGDMVLSRNPETFEQGYKPVVNLFTTHPKQVVRLNIEGASGLEMIVATPEHPFYDENQAEFVSAGELDGTSLLATSFQGETAYVTDIESQRGPPAGSASWITYNFEVADWHTFFVGKNSLWVHNSGDNECERMFSIFNWMIERHNGDEDLAYLAFKDRFSTEKSSRIKGLIADVLVRDRNPDIILQTQIWTNGPPNDGYANLFNHWKKRQDKGQLLSLDTPMKYLERAVEVSRQTATIPDGDLEWAVYWEFIDWGDYGPRWEKIAYNKNTQEKCVKIVSGSHSGQIKTLHPIDNPGDSVSLQIQKAELDSQRPDSNISLFKPEGAVD